MDLQKLMTTISKASEAEAVAGGVMTIGALVDALKLVPAHTPVMLNGHVGVPRGDSYRGYYVRFAFGSGDGPNLQTAGELLTYLQDKVIGHEFTGYKGGEYEMGRGTLLHAAPYGSTGVEVCGVELQDGVFVLKTQEEVW